MIKITAYEGKSVSVFGLGKTGIAATEALLHSGAKVYAWDDQEEARAALPEGAEQLSILPPQQCPWEEMEALILSPGVPLTHPAPHAVVKLAQEADIPIICDIELLYQAVPEATFVGITGTNGKSTTTALVGHILQEAGLNCQVGGNIGVPASALEPLGKDGIYVLETSSYQLDLLQRTKFNIAVLLNITPDHLDRHGGMEGYVAAKQKIFARQGGSDTAIIATDDNQTNTIYQNIKENSESKILIISNQQKQENGIAVIDGIVQDFSDPEGSQEYPLGDLPRLPGEHNAQNIAAAFAVAKSLDVAPEKIIAGIQTFPGLAHRIELIDVIDGVTYINDSKATNAVAAQKALQSFDNIYWIAGGLAKEGGIASLEPLFPRIKHVFLIGDAEEEFANTLEEKLPYTRCGELPAAFAEASAMASAGGGSEGEGTLGDTNPIVLLSPACASFDQFPNFETRGDAFRELVLALRNKTVATA